jgi:hypothetical protein
MVAGAVTAGIYFARGSDSHYLLSLKTFILHFILRNRNHEAELTPSFPFGLLEIASHAWHHKQCSELRVPA